MKNRRLGSWKDGCISDCLSSSLLSITSLLGLYLASIFLVSFLPSEPVPPVMSIVLPLRSIEQLLAGFAKRECNKRATAKPIRSGNKTQLIQVFMICTGRLDGFLNRSESWRVNNLTKIPTSTVSLGIYCRVN